jgi:hypothetical protein
MTMSKKPGAKVRGTCKNGHVTETTAEPTRLTWKGPCSHEGCDLEVIAKRIKTTEAAKEPTGKKPASRVRKVSGYDNGKRTKLDGAGAGKPAKSAPEPDGGKEPEPTFSQLPEPDDGPDDGFFDDFG